MEVNSSSFKPGHQWPQKIGQGTRAPFQYQIRRLIVRSRKDSKLRDLHSELCDRSEIWQAHRQQGCRSACQISKRCGNLNYQSRGFATSRDLTSWSCKLLTASIITFSALLALCAGNSPVLGEFASQRPVTPSFDLNFSLICAWTSVWVNTRDAGDLRCPPANYDVNAVINSIHIVGLVWHL